VIFAQHEFAVFCYYIAAMPTQLAQKESQRSLPWLKSYSPQIRWDDDIPVAPLSELLDSSAANHGPRPCVEFKGRSYSYAEIKALSDRAAAGLVAAGFKPGMKLGLFLPNCPMFLVFYFGGLKAGGIIVNYNPLYAEDEIMRQIADTGTDMMVTLDVALLFDKFAHVFERSALQKLIVCSLADQLPPFSALLFRSFKRKEIAHPPSNPKVVTAKSLLHNDGAFEPIAINPKTTIALLQCTGGTTGTPKAAALTHANIYANAIQCTRWFYNAASPEARSVGVLPLFHAFAMTCIMNWSIAVGGSMLLEPRFEAKSLLRLIHKRKPSILCGVPTLYTALMNAPDFAKYDLSSLKHCISGGASLPRQVQEEFEKLTGTRMVEGYGLSEASPVACIVPVHRPAPIGSVGLPLPQTLCRIVSLEDRKTPVPQGERGEICFQGPQIMSGYYNNPEATAEVIQEGWLHTGDVGYMDDDGFVFITDRLKEMITVSGFKVYPRQVEEAIYQHPAVRDCAVYGIDDAYKGQTIRAAISFKEGSAATQKELDQFLESRLSIIERPRSYDFRADLPKTIIGKIQKKVLIEEHRMQAEAAKEKIS
jgi:long-chain acyl-CoA synthetase